MPSRLLWEPTLRPLLEEYGAAACRLWLLLLSDPAFLYGTNPSTLAVFLDRLQREWDDCVALVRAHAAGKLGELTRDATRRVGSPGFARRLERAASAAEQPPLEQLLENLRCYACWDGGYVRPFLERVEAALPAPRFAHVPMYSMATETVQTTTYYGRDGRPHFLPLVPGVLYEFLPAGAPDDPAALLGSDRLETGQEYCLVVSDGYGLRRYQTDDLFLCQERVRGLPDLRFLRRQGLAYSFTGEKLSGEQVEAAFARLRERLPALAGRGVQLTLLPARPGGDALDADSLPHYRLVLAWPGEPDPSVDPAQAAALCQELLAELNPELPAKLGSGRLGPFRGVALGYDTLARTLGGGAQAADAAPGRGWEMQFKLLPLYARTWEDAGLPELEPQS